MNSGKNEIVFTEKEKKAISIAGWLVNIMVLTSVCFNFLNKLIDKVGVHILYLFCILALVVDLIVIAFVILFFAKLHKIKRYCVRYITILILSLIAGTGITYLATDYAIDIFAGTDTITTNEYVVSENHIRFLDNKGEEIYIPLSDKAVVELNENSHIAENQWSENALIYHTNTITIEYYPNSKVVLNISVN